MAKWYQLAIFRVSREICSDPLEDSPKHDEGKGVNGEKRSSLRKNISSFPLTYRSHFSYNPKIQKGVMLDL